MHPQSFGIFLYDLGLHTLYNPRNVYEQYLEYDCHASDHGETVVELHKSIHYRLYGIDRWLVLDDGVHDTMGIFVDLVRQLFLYRKQITKK